MAKEEAESAKEPKGAKKSAYAQAGVNIDVKMDAVSMGAYRRAMPQSRHSRSRFKTSAEESRR